MTMQQNDKLHMKNSSQQIKRLAKTGGAFAVISAAIFGVLVAAGKVSNRKDDAMPYYGNASYESAPIGTSTTQAPKNQLMMRDIFMPKSEKQLAAAAGFSGLVGAFIAAFGADYLWAALGQFANWLGRLSKIAAKAPIKAAKIAAKGTAKFMGQHGRWVMLFAGLGIFAFTGLSIMDFQWEAALIIGTSAAGALTYGGHKTTQAAKSATAYTMEKSAAFGENINKQSAKSWAQLKDSFNQFSKDKTAYHQRDYEFDAQFV